ncbi:MAG: hypothetical protein WC676_01865 [Candidatus Omnitrophota bacterium]
MAFRKIVLCVVLLSFVYGCETAKGFQKDVVNGWDKAKHVDEWFKENMW